MRADPDLAAAAALLADPSRAAMLTRLLDGRGWTATELAKVAAIRPSTASAHLSRMLDLGWITVHPQGRHRYFQLAGPPIAAFLESIALASPGMKARTPGEIRASAALRHCRLCYDHLAGRVGVAISEHLIQRGWITEAFHLTHEGRQALGELGFHSLADEGRGCMDWSERRLHLAGPLGRSLAEGALASGWFLRDPASRILRPTPLGLERMAGWLHHDWAGAS
ncbi:MAG: winged helix-turn-helix transcriptional regulator [Acidobacteria bacterium]|nr:winged helix-turn-helix transcriptional regulator [Acidobacteriota bacterium]